jgi:hypothetical protein
MASNAPQLTSVTAETAMPLLKLSPPCRIIVNDRDSAWRASFYARIIRFEPDLQSRDSIHGSRRDI